MAEIATTRMSSKGQVVIAANDIPDRSFSKAFPDLLVSKYRHHYIFYLKESLPGQTADKPDTHSKFAKNR